jgi:hypothetical protein
MQIIITYIKRNELSLSYNNCYNTVCIVKTNFKSWGEN